MRVGTVYSDCCSYCPELSLWTKGIEWSHPSTMSSYSESRAEVFWDRRGHSPITVIFRGWKGDNPRLSHFSGAGKGTTLSMVLSSLAQIQPKSQFLFRKNLPLRDFSIMTLLTSIKLLWLLAEKNIKRNFCCSFTTKMQITNLKVESKLPEIVVKRLPLVGSGKTLGALGQPMLTDKKWEGLCSF